MKLYIQLLSVILPASQAAIMGAMYGACMNRTRHDENPPPGTLQGYHCHFSSRDCVDGEEWMTPNQVEEEELICTCDDNYNENVYGYACYSMVTHIVTCVAEKSDCMEGAYTMGPRYNARHEVEDTCAIGSEAFGAFTGVPKSCGKQCLCNFGYKSRTDLVEAGTTDYGKCYDKETNQQYCAANMMSCADGEDYLGPYTKAFSGPRCGCDRAHTGACIGGGEVAYCAVEADSCESSLSFVNAKELKAMGSNIDCRLCLNTWDAPTVSPAPTNEITQPPTNSPTVSHVPTVTVTLSPTDKTAAPSESPLSAPSTPPTMPNGCMDDPTFKYQGKKRKTCKWVDKNNNKDKLCKKTPIKNACKIVCGECCADDPLGINEKECSKALKKKGKRKKQCPKGSVNTICALTCGRCCYSDKKYKFLVNNKKKPCSFINTAGKVTKYCKDATAKKCGVECGCDDYTVKSPKPPAQKPVLAPADDD